MFSISNLFSKNKINSKQLDKEEQEEQEEQEELYLRCLLFDNDLFKIYKTSSRDFVNNIKMWAFEDEEATKLFLDANNTLNITKKDTNLELQSVLRHFVKEYPGIIVDVKEGSRCNRPRINKRLLAGKLRDLVINYDCEKIIKAISDYNKKLGRISREMLIRKCGSYSDNMYDIAKENGCYLGLVPDFKWVDELDLL